jgi:hypothetical protein
MNAKLYRKPVFAGKKNGELLTLAEAAGFDVLVTVDRGLPHQQNLTGRKIALLVVHAVSNKLNDMLPHMPACLSALRSIEPGQTVRVG